MDIFVIILAVENLFKISVNDQPATRETSMTWPMAK